MSDIDKMLEQAESLQSEGEWEIISKYRRNDTYVDDDGAVNITGRRIDAIRENISVQGENHSQYIEFIMDRYYDGIDLTEQTLAIHYEVGDVSDEDAPINVYKNDTQIKFGWVVENTLTQYEATIEFCIWARGTLPDGNAYVLKTLPQKYEVKRGLEIAGGIIEPTNNWYMQFALTMDQKVAQASENADRAEQAANSLDGVVETVTTARDEVVQKASTVNTQHSEVESWHEEAEQFRNEAEQFRNQAEAIVGIGLAEEGKPGIVQPDGVTTKVDENGKLIVIGGGGGGGGGTPGTTDYEYLDNKPKINGVELSGNKTLEELGFEGTTDYQSLKNKPSIAGIELNGDKSYDELGLVSKDTVARNFETVNQNIQELDDYTQSLGEDIVALDTELEQTNQQLQSTTDKVDDVQESIEAGFKKQAQGEEIHLTDAVDGKVVDFAMYGKSEQNVTSGNQLFDFIKGLNATSKDVTVKDNGDNTLSISGTSTEAGGVFVLGSGITGTNVALNLKAGNYYVSGLPSGVMFFLYKANTEVYEQIDLRSDGSFTLEEDTDFVSISLRWYAGATIDAPSVKIMFNKGTTALPWEPYTGGIPSPNPNYPQEIEVAGASGSIEVTSTNEDASKSTTSIISTPNGLSGIKVSSGGNYTDENGQQWITDEIIRYADGSGEYIQRIGIDKLGNYDYTASVFNGDIYAFVSAQPISNALFSNSSKLLCETFTASGTGANNTMYITGTGNIRCFTSSYTTEEEFKTAISNSKLYYELAEPIIIPLTSEQISEIEKLNTFKPITNISNNEQCGMKITYATLQEALMLQEAYNQSKENAQEIVNVKEEIVDIKKELSDTTFKVDTIIEKADLGIKETASGEEIHLTDSAEGKAVEYSLYGKARQSTTTGKNIAPCTINFPYTQGGLTLTKNEDGSIHVSGTCTDRVAIKYDWNSVDDAPSIYKDGGQYIGSCYTSKGNITKSQLYFELSYFDAANAMLGYTSVIEGQNTFTPSTTDRARDYLIFNNAKESSVTYDMDIYPMIRKASITDDTWEPYTNGASPNPDYPQEIEVSGESYNLLENTATSQTINGVEFVVNEDKSVTANGTASADTSFSIVITNLEKGKEYKISTGLKNSTSTTYFIRLGKRTSDVDSWGNEPLICLDNEYTFIADSDYGYVAHLRVMNGVTVNKLTFYPMIRKASVKNDRYMPYGKGSVEVKSLGKNEIVGSQDWSGNWEHLGAWILSDEVYNGLLVRSYTGAWNGLAQLKHVNKGDKYTFSAFVKSDTDFYIFVRASDTFTKEEKADVDNISQLCTSNNKWERVSITFAVTKSGYIAPRIEMSASGNVSICGYQLEKNSSITEYEPYKETLATIPTENGLAGIKVTENGNYTDKNGQQWICDEIVKYADGSGKHIQRIGKIVDDGTKGFFYFYSSANTFFIHGINANLNNDGIDKHLLCNKYIVGNSTPKVNKTIYTYTSNNIQMIALYDTDLATINDLNNSFKENPIEIYYVYKEPIETPLTAEEIAEISTFYPVTNISNDFDCGMRIEYVGDGIITTNTEIPIVEPFEEEELQDGDNIVTLFGKIKKLLKNVGKGVVDVVDNLLSTSTTLPLSANQGRVLDEKITVLNESLEDISKVVNEQLVKQMADISTRLSALEQNQKTIVYSDTEPETVEENTIVMVYETEE